MSTKLLFPFISLATLIPTGGYIYKIYPKTIGENLIWYGNILAENEKDYKAIFFENKNEIENLSVSDLTKGTQINTAWTKIKEWCEKNLSSPMSSDTQLIDKIKKFCTKNVKTLQGQLINSGYSDFEKDKQEDSAYKAIFSYYKSENDFISTIDSTLSSTTDNNTGKEKLKSWCETQLKQEISEGKITENQIKNVIWYCKPINYSTLEDVLKLKIKNSSTDEEWKERFEKWKNTEEVLKDIKGDENTLDDKEKGGPKMKTWCTDNLSKKIEDIENLKQLSSWIKSACITETKN